MASELKWSSKRQNQEFEKARDFLMSMGLHPSLKEITFEDVKSGNLAPRDSLSQAPRTAELSDPAAGNKAERRQIPVERSGKRGRKSMAPRESLSRRQRLTDEAYITAISLQQVVARNRFHFGLP